MSLYAAKMIADGNAPEEIKRIERAKLNALLDICETTACRRQAILAHFGEAHPGSCRNCDNCLVPVDTWDATDAAVKAMAAIYRTGERFGVTHVVDVLTGKTSEKVERLGHDRLPVFGAGKETDAKVWQSVMRQLTAAGFITVDPEHGGLKLTAAARPVFKGERKVTLRRERPRQKEQRRAKASAELGSGAMPLFDDLRAERARIARVQGVPPYVVFHDSSLRAMASARPQTLEAMAGIPGVGKAKLERYGALFLAVIQGAG